MGSIAEEISTSPEIIELSGTPREIGLKHGRLLSPKIHSQLSIYAAMFLSTSSLDWPSVLSLASEYNTTISTLTPSLHEEMVGIADGAGVDILDIVALNCRSEIVLGNFRDGCTSLGWKTKGGDGETWLCQNWDWTKRVKGNLVMMSIKQVGKPKIWMVTEAGIIGKIGFNSSSLGVCLNAIRAKPSLSSKIPIHLALRLCLESPTIASALSTLNSLGGVASAQHILIASATESPLSLELSPLGDTHIQPSVSGIVCHSNHFITNTYVSEPPWLKGSPIRLERARSLSKELDEETDGKPTAEGLRRKVFSDGFNRPQAICCEEDPERPVESRSSTLFNICMKLKEGVAPCAEVVWGRPGSGCEGGVLKMPW